MIQCRPVYIRYLSCGGNTAIEDAGWASLVEVLPQLSYLDYLDVEVHCMSDATVFLLAAAIGSCPKLTNLNVRYVHRPSPVNQLVRDVVGGGAQAALRAAWAPRQAGLRM